MSGIAQGIPLTPNAAPVPKSGGVLEEWLSPKQLGRVMRRNWKVMLATGIVCAVGAYAGSAFLLTPQFTTQGTLTIDTQDFAIPELQGALKGESLPDPMPMVRSEVQILSSRSLVGQVVDQLHLVEDPEFNASLRVPTAYEKMVAWIKAHMPGAATKPPGVASRDMIRDAVIAAVQHNLSVINDNRSLVINLQFTSEDPKVAADVVNGLMQRYIADRTALQNNANREANAVLLKRVDEVKDEVAQLEQRIQQTRQKNDLVQTRAGSVGQQQLEDLSAALTRASADRAQIEANYQRARVLAATGGAGADSSEVLQSATVAGLRDKEAAAERRVAQLSQTLGPGHPALRAAQAELASTRAAIAGEAKRVLVSLGAQADAVRAREADLKNQLAQSQQAAGKQSAVQSDLQQLEKDADARRQLYQTLLQRAELTQANKGGPQQPGARLVSNANVPAWPTSPRPKLAAGLGLISGFAFAGFISLLRGAREKNFSEPDDIASDTGLSTLTVVPRAMGLNATTSLASRVAAAPSGPEAEALRALRTRLRFVGRGAAPRSILFVSSVAGEGASSIAAAFARLAAIDGLRVLLVEGDLSNPSLSRILNAPPSNGLIETLLGRDHWRDVVATDTQSQLDFLLVQGPQPGANQLLESMQLQNLIADARDEYNLIVMDGQPVAQATHSMILAHSVDVVVLVVEAGATARETVREAIDAVSAAATKTPVLALNKAAA